MQSVRGGRTQYPKAPTVQAFHPAQSLLHSCRILLAPVTSAPISSVSRMVVRCDDADRARTHIVLWEMPYSKHIQQGRLACCAVAYNDEFSPDLGIRSASLHRIPSSPCPVPSKIFRLQTAAITAIDFDCGCAAVARSMGAQLRMRACGPAQERQDLLRANWRRD